MKTRSVFKKLWALTLALTMLITVLMPITASAISLDTSKLGSDMYLTSKTDYAVAPGIQESQITINNGAGNNQAKGVAVFADLSNPTVSVLSSYKDYNANSWGMQKLRDQAYAAEKKLGANVVAGVNGDFYNMGTGAPAGTLVMNGTVYNKVLEWPYFAILKDGKAKIGRTSTDAEVANFQNAIGGPCVILEDGKATSDSLDSGYGKSQMPRSAVGITADGNVVFYVVDGRQAPTSCGMNFYQLANTMLALGCVDALALDGGGSTTLVSQHEGSEELVCRNSPSDGTERPVSSALLIASTATPTGEFHHATISPNNEVYSPGSSVEFTASGVDSAGLPASLPENGYLALSDDSFGTMSAGVFTSNGKTGTVQVDFISGGAVHGSTTIDIQAPDSFSFAKEIVNLAFNQQTDFAVTAHYKGREINIKDGDIVWTAASTTEGIAASEMGTFSGNTFTASPTASVNGKVTATSAFDSSVSATVTVEIGRQPYVVWDFEVPEYYTFATGYLEANGGILQYLTGDDKCNMLLGTYINNDLTPRGAKGTAEVVDIDTGEVRMGSHSLKINYDFTAQGATSIDGVCIGAFKPTLEMEGTPTAVGLWVYAPEGTPNFWLRMRVNDMGANGGEGQTLTLNFTAQSNTNPPDGVGGINWQGWKYVEAQLTGIGPYQLLGGESVRFMNCPTQYGNGDKTVTGIVNEDGTYQYKTVVAADRIGHVYIDNVQFVYGSNTQDVDNPVIDRIIVSDVDRINDMDIINDLTINMNDVCIRALFHDVQNEYTTGIDYAHRAYALYIDGKNVTDTTVCNDDDEMYYYATLADGVHSVKVLIRDGFGNETTETRYFTVETGVEHPNAALTPVEDVSAINKDFSLELTTNAPEQVEGIITEITVDPTIVKSEDDITVTYADGYSGQLTYNAEKGLISLDISGVANSLDGKIATLTFNIPADIAHDKSFTYRVTRGEIDFGENEIATDTFATAAVTVPITASYTVTMDTLIVGTEGANIYVNDAEGNPVSGVGIYLADGTLIGTTNENGVYFSTEFASSAQEFTIYASKDSEYSFRETYQSFTPAANADGTPSYILSVAAEDGATQKKLTWMANPIATAAAAKVQYAEVAAGESAFVTLDGTSEILVYNGSDTAGNRAARINCVLIEGLKEDTEYIYRVGDGTTWSAVKSFTTAKKNAETNFFVFGDIQAQDMTIAKDTVKKIGTDGVDYDFGIQVGDAVETGNIYSLWTDVLDVFAAEEIQPTDMVHVYGNHEFFADENAISSQLMFGLDDEQHNYYSVEYGNVYVAVINWQIMNNEKAYYEAAQWLKQDAAQSDCMWKILAIHPPVYNTNLSAAIPWISEDLPSTAQAAGIDVVFSGHDHAYSRTSPMIDGQIDEDGIVYYICGNVGEKSYAAQITPEYNIAHFIPRSEYTGLYLSVTATDTALTVETINVSGSDSMSVDSYTITREDDCTTGGHEYVYADGYLTCSVCGYALAIEGYTGFAVNAQGASMYFINGTAMTGWFTLGEDQYYFNQDGAAQTGVVTVDGHSYTFGEDGKMIKGALERNSDGTYSYYINGEKQRGWHQIDGYWYFFSRSNDNKSVSGMYTITNMMYTFDINGRLIVGAWSTTDTGKCYYWGPSPVIGLQEIEGETYYFYPSNTYMCTTSVEIDGVVYAFASDGKFVHNGEHADADGDGRCDICDENQTVVSTIRSLFQRIAAFFRNILRFFGLLN